VLDFGFKCNHSDQTAGLSIPLLSVGIAALMAIFLDMDLAAHVTQTSLIHVLREASKGLLDPRLNAASPTDFPDLDDATCKKMAKAMNKVCMISLQLLSSVPWYASSLFSLHSKRHQEHLDMQRFRLYYHCSFNYVVILCVIMYPQEM
jgi:hypothetical protein